MYTDRIKGHNFFIAIAVLTLFVGGSVDHFAYAKSDRTPRLSSNRIDLRDPFAVRPINVNTPKEFAKFLQKNAALRQRYARHYHLPQDKIVAFVQNALVPYKLPAPHTMTTFGVTKRGMIYPVTTHLRAGAMVWATRDGRPILKWDCLNPLSYRLPGTELKPPLMTIHNASSISLVSNPDFPPQPESADSVDSPPLPFSGDSVAVITVPPTDDSAMIPPLPIATSSSLPVPGGVVSGGGSHLQDLWPALLIPLAFIHTGGSSGTIVTPPPTFVPETNTVSLMLTAVPFVGGGLLLAHRSRRRKSEKAIA